MAARLSQVALLRSGSPDREFRGAPVHQPAPPPFFGDSWRGSSALGIPPEVMLQHPDVASGRLPKELRDRHAGGVGRAVPAVALLDRDARGGELVTDDA